MIIRATLLISLLLTGGAAASSNPMNEAPQSPGARIVAPWETVQGFPQSYWAHKWWTWIIDIRQEVNPNFEAPGSGNPTGGKYASINNDGPIVFLPGSSVPGVATRTLTIPPDRPVLVPVINIAFVAFGDISPCTYPLTLSCALGVISPALDHATGMRFTVDGVELGQAQLRAFRQTSQLVSPIWVNPDPDSIYGLFGKAPGVYGYFANALVQDGYYVFLDHLTPGKHVIKTQGTIGAPFNQTYQVTSTVCVGVRTTVAGACHE